MKTLIISSSFAPVSKSFELAKLCQLELEKSSEVELLSLVDYPLHSKDLHDPLGSENYLYIHKKTLASDALVFASPVYNWSICAELKKYIEIIGTTPPQGPFHGAFYDKVLTFVNTAGVPHSYTAFTAIASSMMLDYKCIISPYNLYVTERDWENNKLSKKSEKRLAKSMKVLLELTSLLKARTYSSSWEI